MCIRINLTKMPGHSGIIGNEIVDQKVKAIALSIFLTRLFSAPSFDFFNYAVIVFL